MRKFSLQSALALVIGTISTLTVSAAEFNAPKGFMDGVQAYRAGEYKKAEKILNPLHEQAADKSEIAYYLALSKTQLGDYKSARKLYEEVVLLDPNSEAARLSKIGLSQLDTLAQNQQALKLDPPPSLLPSPSASPSTAIPTAPPAQTQTASTPPQPSQPVYQQPGISPQDIMMMQMMLNSQNPMNSMGGGNNGMGNMGNTNNMLNPMMIYGMLNQQQSADPNNPNSGQNQNIDPELFSQMMMNQMMQNFSLQDNNDNDR
ncbi:MAG: tetratricopeptide repeat protein [Vampirovibrionales bacterium]|nr:tetratricopeptide repeat protein [Vampirovibrionales bacterium]